EQDVALVNLDVAGHVALREALVMVVDGDGQDALGTVLADHVLVEFLLDGARRGDVGERRPGAVAAALLLVDDGLAQLDALAADVDVAGPFHEGADLAIVLAAEGAVRVAIPARPSLGPILRSSVASIFGRHAVSFGGRSGSRRPGLGLGCLRKAVGSGR